MDDKTRWNEIYRDYPPSKLPWYGLPFIKHVSKFLKGLNKSDLLIVSGCGVGDTVNILYKKGFTNLLGTDISSEAIDIAKKRFPHLNFRCIVTEDLYNFYKNANVIDWLNLHQINPEILPSYLKSLSKVSKSLLLVYFYDPLWPVVRESIIKGSVYNHDPQMVSNLLSPLKKIKEFSFDMGINKKFGEEHRFKALAQVYSIK